MKRVRNQSAGFPKATMHAHQNAFRNSEPDVAALLQAAHVVLKKVKADLSKTAEEDEEEDF